MPPGRVTELTDSEKRHFPLTSFIAIYGVANKGVNSTWCTPLTPPHHTFSENRHSDESNDTNSNWLYLR